MREIDDRGRCIQHDVLERLAKKLSLGYSNKKLARSTELRKWFHAVSAEHWDEFKQRYLKELETNPAVKELLEIVSHHKVTLLYSAKDVEHNHAIILKEYLLEKSKS